MSAIAKLKAGIRTMDWSLVLGAYNDMTGDSSVELPQGDLGPTDLRSIRFAIHKAVDEALQPFAESRPDAGPEREDDTGLERRDEEPPPVVQPVAHGSIVGFSLPPTEREIEEGREISRTIGVDRKTRPPIKPVTAECSECGQRFESPINVGGDMGTLCSRCLKARKPHRS